VETASATPSASLSPSPWNYIRLRFLATAAAATKTAPTPAAATIPLEPPPPVILMKKGLTSYFQAPQYEVVVPALQPYMSKYEIRKCLRMRPIPPCALQIYGESLQVKLSDDSRTIHASGRLGTGSLKLHESVAAAVGVDSASGERYVVFSALPMHRRARAMMGTMRGHAANLMHGVQFLHSRRLKLVGVGYRAKIDAAPDGQQMLELRVGFSHAVSFPIPTNVTAELIGKEVIALKGVDLQSVMLTAAMIRRIRPPNAYTGQGIRYTNEIFVAKPGKKKG